GVLVPLLVAKTNFSPRSRMRRNVDARSPMGASAFQMTPSMSRMRALMCEGIIILHVVASRRRSNLLSFTCGEYIVPPMQEEIVSHGATATLRSARNDIEKAHRSLSGLNHQTI